MKKFTQEEFNDLEIKNGYRICPTGNYTNIKNFGDNCIIGSYCTIGNNSVIGKSCRIGYGSIIGNNCTIGNFGVIGKDCIIGSYGVIGTHSTFGSGCTIGAFCTIGYSRRIGYGCTFGIGLIYNDIKVINRRIVSIVGIGESEAIYKWVSIGNVNHYQDVCFFGTEEELRKSINEKYGIKHIYHDAIDFINKISVE